MTAIPQTVLGFDYGERRIGVAVGHTLTRTAGPLRWVAMSGRRPDWPVISELLEQWEPQRLVVGMPINMDGSDHWLAPRIERFSRQLHGRYCLPVSTIDERLTTVEARQREQAVRRSGLDAVAAQVILESWLSYGSEQTTCAG